MVTECKLRNFTLVNKFKVYKKYINCNSINENILTVMNYEQDSIENTYTEVTVIFKQDLKIFWNIYNKLYLAIELKLIITA